MLIRQNKILRITAIVVFSAIFVALTGIMILYFVTQHYLNKNLSELVEKKSKGKYELTYESLQFNLKEWGIDVIQVSFHPSDSIISSLKKNETTRKFYSFSSPVIKFTGLNLYELVFGKKLNIGGLSISKPELKIHGQQSSGSSTKNNLDELILELKPLVTKSFKSIRIGKIELLDASYDFYNLMGETRKLANAENISIGVLDFYTDSLLLPNPDRLFDASDIYIRMQKYQNRLADSIHRISAQSVTYSLKKSVIQVQNLELRPLTDQIQPKSKYYFFIPEARITTRHIKDFYKNNTIPIDSLDIKSAKINYWPGSKKMLDNGEPTDEFDLNDLIRNEFAGITIRDFKLRNATLSLFKSQTDTASQQHLKNISLSLTDFKLDSTAQNDTSRVFYARDIDFSANGYELVLGDNLHHVKAEKLSLSTRKQSVLVQNIRVFPAGNKDVNTANNIDASCDSVRLDQFNFPAAYHQKRFFFQKINVFNPEVRITQNIQATDRNQPASASFIYNLISRYVKGVYSKQVLVQQGKVGIINKTGVIQTGTIESAIRLQLSGFALDENSARRTDRLFYANQIELNFNDYQMHLADQLHKLTIGNLSISTRKKQARLENLHLFPVSNENMDELLKRFNRSELYEFTIPELILTNADFHEAFFHEKLSVDSLRITTPRIYYEHFAQLKALREKQDFDDLFRLISNYLTDIQIQVTEIPDGNIRLINHNKKDKTISLDNRFSLKLGNLHINQDQFDQKKLLFSDYVDFSVRDHLFHLSDNVHVLRAGEIGFSTRLKEVFATNARLYPETGSKDFSAVPWNIQLSIPEIRFKGININDFFFDHVLNAENLIINSPEIKLYQKLKPNQKKDIKEMVIPLPKELESISLQNFTLNDGSLKVFSEIGVKPFLLVQSDIKMNARNILIEKSKTTGVPEFKKGDYSSDLILFRFTPKDKNQQYQIDELNFSTANRRIQAKNLVVKPITRNNRQNQYELQVPLLTMNGIDLDKAYKSNLYSFDLITVDRPVFQRYINAKDSLKVNPFKVNFYPYFESFADGFYAGTLQIRNADIVVFQGSEKKFQENLSINLEKVKIENKPSQGFMHSSDFSFKIPSLKKQGKLYRFEAGETSYSSVNNKFTINGIRIIPNFKKDVFQKKTGVQTDYFSGKIDSVTIARPDIKRWFEKEELLGRNLMVHGLKLDIYRDKRTPFDEMRRPKVLQELIKSIGKPVALDSLVVSRSEITYTEHAPTDDREGSVHFSDVHAQIFPFTNIRPASGLYPNFELKGSATLQDSCHLKVLMNYDMNSTENKFTVNGSLGTFNMRIMNPVLEPLALISIRSGKVNTFQFDFAADQYMANGYLYFGYDNLKISVLEIKDGTTKEARLASFLANSLLLRSKNPRGKELLPDEIAFRRDEKRSVLNYWWKSVFSGIRNTLGIKENKPEDQH